jgi:DNA-binding NtrC family response regulator
VLQLDLPPLRDRPDDIPLLLEHFLPAGSPPPGADILAELTRRPWHGNVRELRNFVERALAFGADEALEAPLRQGPSARVGALPDVPLDRSFKDIREEWLDHLEREYVGGLLKRQGGNVSAVAQAAGLNRTYIHRLIRKHNL